MAAKKERREKYPTEYFPILGAWKSLIDSRGETSYIYRYVVHCENVSSGCKEKEVRGGGKHTYMAEAKRNRLLHLLVMTDFLFPYFFLLFLYIAQT